MQTLTPNLALRRTEQFPLPISHGRPRQHSGRLLCSWLATTQATLAEVVLFIPQATTSSRSMRPSPPVKGSVALLLSGCGRLRFCPKQPCSQLPRGAISPGDAHEGSELRARSRVEAKPRPPLACGASPLGPPRCWELSCAGSGHCLEPIEHIHASKLVISFEKIKLRSFKTRKC